LAQVTCRTSSKLNGFRAYVFIDLPLSLQLPSAAGCFVVVAMVNDDQAIGNDTVTFDIGGEKYKVLEQTIRAKPETLLCTLLDDPARQAQSDAIFVEGNPKRFGYILDWYRYGSINIPRSIGMDEMKRECAFFQLPDDVKISRERASLEEAVECLQEVRKKARKDAQDANHAAQEPQVAAFVATVFSEIVGSQELTNSGLGNVELNRNMLAQLNTITFPLESSKILDLLIAKAVQFGWTISKQERVHLKRFAKKLVDMNKMNLEVTGRQSSHPADLHSFLRLPGTPTRQPSSSSVAGLPGLGLGPAPRGSLGLLQTRLGAARASSMIGAVPSRTVGGAPRQPVGISVRRASQTGADSSQASASAAGAPASSGA